MLETTLTKQLPHFLPEHMKRAMANQAESERDRRARVIHAEGEFEAASRLRDAADVIQQHPMWQNHLDFLSGGNP
jgi:hypothetical protein